MGSVIYENSTNVVRVLEKEDGTLQIMVHNKDAEGREIKPKGYMLGTNMLMRPAAKGAKSL